MNEILLAFAILTNPANTEVDRIQVAMAAPYLIEIAVVLELVDYRELEYVRRDTYFLGITLPDRYRQLQDAPSFNDWYRFEIKDSQSKIDFNRNSKTAIGAVMRESAEKNKIMEHFDRLHMIWILINEINNVDYYMPIRREALKNLKEAIGEESYYRSSVPNCVPINMYIKLR